MLTPTVKYKQTPLFNVFGHKLIMSLFQKTKLFGHQYQYNIGNMILQRQSSLCVVTQSHYAPLYCEP